MNHNLERLSSQSIRQIILEQSKRAHVGHIGSSLSVADIIAVLYGSVLNIQSPEDEARDRFILSKGHAVLAVYAALYLRGWLTQKELDQYCGDGSLLGVHPESSLRGIDFSTGSLGQGLSFGVGTALAAKLKKCAYKTYVVMSDAECNEGSVWESVMFARHHQLSSLIVILDLNAQQAFGYTKDVINLDPMTQRWQAFGWDVHEVDGHDERQLKETMNGLNAETGAPHLVIAKTVFGKGVSYMENKIKWHYWPMSDQEYYQALEEVNCGTRHSVSRDAKILESQGTGNEVH